MKKLSFIAVLVMVIGICFTVSTFADFYVIPVEKKSCYPTSTIVPKTGQTDCYKDDGFQTGTCTCGTTDCPEGQDGEYQMGNMGVVAPSATNPYTVPSWEGKRFTDNNDGTITDNLTGLIWLKNANCFGTRTWTNALSDCNSLANGSCGLTDGSTAGDWRLPNFNELRSLDDSSQANPCLPSDHPFTNVQTLDYWSSTTYGPDTRTAWVVYMDDGHATYNNKAFSSYVWPVRSEN